MTSPFPETIPELLAWRARTSEAAGRAGPWLRFEDDSWTSNDVLVETDRMAVGLAERGVERGDVVAILAGNRPETLFAWFAANRLGAIAMPLNTAYKPAELRGVLALTKPRLIVASEELADLAIAAGGTPTAPDALGRGGGGSRHLPALSVTPDDVAVLLATSGTTGAPKAVMQTHRTYTLTAEAFPWWLGLDASDRLLTTLPLFHVNAQAYSTMGALGCGAGLSLLPRFSASRFLDDVRRHDATQVNAVGAMIHILLSTEPRANDRDHRLRLCYSALALPEERHRAFEERYGVEMLVGYGLSETTFGTVWSRDERPRPYGTMGKLRQHPRLGEINRGRVLRDDGSIARDDETGELWLSNPAMMRGYLGSDASPWQTDESGVRWFATGDLVRRDASGAFVFVSRKKEVLRRRGENVAAAEIETALAAHPAVLENAVVGVPSSLGEDDIVAFVALRPGQLAPPEALRAFVAERLADFKVPVRIHLVERLPRTPTERVAKHLLREPAAR